MNAPTPQLPDERQLVQACLRRRLDPHLGQTRRRFEQALAAERFAARPAPAAPAATAWQWRIGIGLLTAAAAGLALMAVLWPVLRGEPGRPSPVVQGEPVQEMGEAGYVPLEYRESWQARDLGMYELGGRPVRAVHRQQWESARFRNEQGYEVSIEMPAQQLVFVDAPVQ